MIYRLFLSIMDFLTDTFGYIGALRIKDILDNLAWGIVFAMLLFWVMAHALLELYKSKTVEKEVAVHRVEF